MRCDAGICLNAQPVLTSQALSVPREAYFLAFKIQPLHHVLEPPELARGE
jgi:hypothetical protein